MKNFWKSLFNTNKEPVINILIRTSNRPKYFKSCIESVFQQSYKHIKIFVSYDDLQSYEYLKSYKGIKTLRVFSKQENYPKQDVLRGSQQKKFPANLFLNDLMNEVNSGYILVLDDDDYLISPNSIQTIVDNISGDDDLLFWRVQLPGSKVIPEDEYFGKAPVFLHIAGIGFTFNHKYINNAQWDGWKGGDYAVATKLYMAIPNKIYIDKVLTGLQRTTGMGGFGNRDDKVIGC